MANEENDKMDTVLIFVRAKRKRATLRIPKSISIEVNYEEHLSSPSVLHMAAPPSLSLLLPSGRNTSSATWHFPILDMFSGGEGGGRECISLKRALKMLLNTTFIVTSAEDK